MTAYQMFYLMGLEMKEIIKKPNLRAAAAAAPVVPTPRQQMAEFCLYSVYLLPSFNCNFVYLETTFTLDDLNSHNMIVNL